MFLLEGLLIFVIGFISFLYLPQSPTQTTGALWRKRWYTEREEVIMINYVLRDDPAKGIVAFKEPATFKDIRNAWSDPSMWSLYFIGLVAYIPATPVQSYLTLTLKKTWILNFQFEYAYHTVCRAPDHHYAPPSIQQRVPRRTYIPLHIWRILDSAASCFTAGSTGRR